MIRAMLAGFALALMFATVAQAKPTPPPLPDPHPSSCFQGWCAVLTFVAYDIDLPAVNAATGEIIPGIHFRCHVPVRWHGKPNRYGRSTCVLVPGDYVP